MSRKPRKILMELNKDRWRSYRLNQAFAWNIKFWAQEPKMKRLVKAGRLKGRWLGINGRSKRIWNERMQ